MPSSPAEPSRSLIETATFSLVAAGREAQRRLEERLAARGVTLRHLGALGHLRADADLSYSDLARRAGVAVPSMHATVRRLEELGTVTRAAGGQGVRARLELTEAGVDLLSWARAQADEVDAELFTDVDDQQLAFLRRTLRAIAMSRFGEATR